MSTNKETLKRLFSLMGDAGWDVIKKAIQAEIDDRKFKLKELQSIQAELLGRPPKIGTPASVSASSLDEAELLEKIADILLRHGEPLSTAEIVDVYIKETGKLISASFVSGCLSRNKGVKFEQHGNRRWTRWSVMA